MECKFVMGQKVVFVEDDIEPHRGEVMPKVGHTYTIRDIILRDVVCLLLVEIRNKPRQYIDTYGECAFRAHRFRPLTSNDIDISIFTKMLDQDHRKFAEVV